MELSGLLVLLLTQAAGLASAGFSSCPKLLQVVYCMGLALLALVTLLANSNANQRLAWAMFSLAMSADVFFASAKVFQSITSACLIVAAMMSVYTTIATHCASKSSQ